MDRSIDLNTLYNIFTYLGDKNMINAIEEILKKMVQWVINASCRPFSTKFGVEIRQEAQTFGSPRRRLIRLMSSVLSV